MPAGPPFSLVHYPKQLECHGFGRAGKVSPIQHLGRYHGKNRRLRCDSVFAGQACTAFGIASCMAGLAIRCELQGRIVPPISHGRRRSEG
jgi:hypothetical protein